MRTTTVVIGAGHNGLAVSRFLSTRSIDHVVLERGEVANSWRTERWDSLRLLTPNWKTSLPGFDYDGDDPDGYMTMPEVADFIERYAAKTKPPLETLTTVLSVRRNGAGYEVETDRGTWRCRSVVMASGGFNLPKKPPVADALPSSVASVHPLDYRRPSDLRAGGVLVVGASATGIQVAEEIHRSGRPVTISVGEHVRLPRLYRGKDIHWWLDEVGLSDERFDEVDDIVRVRQVPSPQLVGTPEHKTLDLNSLTGIGVRMVGRLADIRDGKALLSGGLRNKCKRADLKMNRLLAEIDEWIDERGLEDEFGSPRRWEPTRVEASPPISLDLEGGAIRTVFWATGYRPDYSWLDVPVLDHRGRLHHEGGVVTRSPGMYRIGLNFLRRRKSSFIHGAEDDARDLVDHLAAYLEERVVPVMSNGKVR